VASSPLDPLRPKPFRGDVIAAGAVVLATLVGVVALRMDGSWGHGVHLGYALGAWWFVTALAVLAPMEGDDPRAYQSVLYVVSIALVLLVLVELARVLGTDGALSSPGTTTWFLGATAVVALAFATRRNSAVCTMLGALAAGGAVLALVEWIWGPLSVMELRRLLLALTVVYVLAAIGQRDRRLRHGVALIDTAGIAVLAIGGSFVVDIVTFGLFGPAEVSAGRGVGWGWELLIVAAGFGLVAYSSIDRQPGPAYFGVANLALFVVLAGVGFTHHDPTLAGWPIPLAVAAVVLLVVGLRPTTPAPPPPDIDAPEPPPLPLR